MHIINARNLAHDLNARNLAHDFGVKLSPCMCSHVRLTWLYTYIYLW